MKTPMRLRNKPLLFVVFPIVLVLTIALWLLYATREPRSVELEAVIRLGYRPLALADVTPVIINEGLVGSLPNLKIDLVPLANPQIALQKFDAGEVDALAGIPLEAILQRMASQGDPGFKAYYFQVDLEDEGWVAIVANRAAPVQRLADLAGRPVASLPTDQARYLLRRILRAAGIADDQINIVIYNPATPLIGLESGEHAAIFGLEPAISRAIAAGHRLLEAGPVSRYLYGGEPIPVSASVISKTFAAGHPEAVDEFLFLIEDAVEVQENTPDRVRELFANPQYGGLDRGIRGRLFLPVMRKTDEGLIRTLRAFVDELTRDGVLKSEIQIDDLLN